MVSIPSIPTAITVNELKFRDGNKLQAIPISEAPEALYNQLTNATKALLEMKYSQSTDLSKNPAFQEYARVVDSNGNVIAKIDNNGYIVTSNLLGARIQDMPSDVNGKSGPLLAHARAEFIAGFTGGKVVKSSTSITQSHYDLIPQPERIIDYTAMVKDPMYIQLQKTEQARTLFLAQQMGQV